MKIRKDNSTKPKNKRKGCLTAIIIFFILCAICSKCSTTDNNSGAGHSSSSRTNAKVTLSVNDAEVTSADAQSSITPIVTELDTTPVAEITEEIQKIQPAIESSNTDISELPEYSDSAYAIVNDNVPYFTEGEIAGATESYEYYSPLDDLGRCQVTVASIGKDLMPTEERGAIGQIKPTGWHLVKYDFIDDNYLYNRCHLIGYQLTGENANECNLITGTRYMNIEGQLPFEEMVADYIKKTGNHVLYRVTPVFEGDNLLAAGVLMEAISIEDGGDGILFNVFCYNVQPGVEIDYATGDNWESGTEQAVITAVATQTPIAKDTNAPTLTVKATGTPTPIARATNTPTSTPTVKATNTPTPTFTATPTPKATITETKTDEGNDYVLNTNTKKFHKPGCSSVRQMNESNKQEYHGTRDDVIAKGYSPCGRCNP